MNNMTFGFDFLLLISSVWLALFYFIHFNPIIYFVIQIIIMTGFIRFAKTTGYKILTVLLQILQVIFVITIIKEIIILFI
ncbi:Uncharacterised protein [Lysinibacillus sphaericus]|nr:Uncharacterised protein [Lysinibacillus sphaericus]